MEILYSNFINGRYVVISLNEKNEIEATADQIRICVRNLPQTHISSPCELLYFKNWLKTAYPMFNGPFLEFNQQLKGGWNRNVHFGEFFPPDPDPRSPKILRGTEGWVVQTGFFSHNRRPRDNLIETKVIAEACDNVDVDLNPLRIYEKATQSWHFDTYDNQPDEFGYRDSRTKQTLASLEEAINNYIPGQRFSRACMNALGRGLHPLQDIFAHADDYSTKFIIDGDRPILFSIMSRLLRLFNIDITQWDFTFYSHADERGWNADNPSNANMGYHNALATHNDLKFAPYFPDYDPNFLDSAVNSRYSDTKTATYLYLLTFIAITGYIVPAETLDDRINRVLRLEMRLNHFIQNPMAVDYFLHIRNYINARVPDGNRLRTVVNGIVIPAGIARPGVLNSPISSRDDLNNFITGLLAYQVGHAIPNWWGLIRFGGTIATSLWSSFHIEHQFWSPVISKFWPDFWGLWQQIKAIPRFIGLLTGDIAQPPGLVLPDDATERAANDQYPAAHPAPPTRRTPRGRSAPAKCVAPPRAAQNQCPRISGGAKVKCSSCGWHMPPSGNCNCQCHKLYPYCPFNNQQQHHHGYHHHHHHGHHHHHHHGHRH